MTSAQFDTDLAWSVAQHHLPWWDSVYREAFPDMDCHRLLEHDGWHQRAGRDRALYMRNSTVLYVDEKARREVWSDIALEVRHDFRERPGRPLKPPGLGWIEKPLGIDYLAYAFIPTQTCYLLPFRLLQHTWRRNRQQWFDATRDGRRCPAGRHRHVGRGGFTLACSPNDDYVTRSVCVPIPVLLDAMRDALIVRWA